MNKVFKVKAAIIALLSHAFFSLENSVRRGVVDNPVK